MGSEMCIRDREGGKKTIVCKDGSSLEGYDTVWGEVLSGALAPWRRVVQAWPVLCLLDSAIFNSGVSVSPRRFTSTPLPVVGVGPLRYGPDSSHRLAQSREHRYHTE